MKRISIAILGYGVVGSGVYSIISGNHNDLCHKDNLDFIVDKILVRSIAHSSQKKNAPVSLFTESIDDILNDDDISIVVECIGGIEPARTYIIEALKKGKTVVTSNKEVISKHWSEFESVAKKTGAGLYMEATVAGGIPILRTINDSMQANNISSVMGIINGTTNYILTKMSEEGLEFADVLKEAQELGYAEADPTADIEAFDATYKLSILSSMAFHAHMPVDVIYREGIQNLTKTDFENAQKLGYTIKLLAIGKKKDNRIEVRVHPTMIPRNHPLASVRGVYNAIFLTGHAVGDIMLYGRGAGCLPTASAVVSDVVYAALADGHHRYMTFENTKDLSSGVELVKDFSCIYCIRLNVVDEPGTMTAVAGCFANHKVSLKEVLQLNNDPDTDTQITFLTHEAHEFSIREALDDIMKLPCVLKLDSLIRAES